MAQVLFIVVVGLLRWAYGSDTTNSRCGVPLTVPDTNRRSEFKRANITDAVQLGAVCNDRSQGIYYIRNSTDTKKWIIYLEGSVGCGNVDDCNKRYVERPELMMSHQYPASIEGRDIFDPDPTVNPDYWDYNMVLIPYCTSDLWVGNSTWDPARGKETFRFNSSATYNQFVFRGLTVFRTVVGELLEEGMDSADDVVLVGSSAGGIGAMNQAGWLRSRLPGNTTFSVILDSAWFTNYDGNLVKSFDFDYVQKSMNIQSHIPCRDVSSVGYPCCVSAPCMLIKAPQNSLDFPDIPVFVIFSQYDLFVLSKSLLKLQKDFKVLELFRIVTKYGEDMKVRLSHTSRIATNMSYFVPSCLQHVYLATSNLREVGGLLRTDKNSSTGEIEFRSGTKYFRSVVEPGMWSNTSITNPNSTAKVTIQCAIHEWNQHLRKRFQSSSYPVRYSDNCIGAICNPQCPESILLGVLGELWPDPVKYLVVTIVLAVTVLSLVYKVVMMWKKYRLFKSYEHFTGDKDTTDTMELGPSKAIGIACLDLIYSVRLSSGASGQAKEEEKRKLAEEEARSLLWCSNSFHKANEQRIPFCNGNTGTTNSQLKDDGDIQENSVHIQTEDESFDNSVREKTILNKISTYFNPGQVVAIMGPSGSGKSTFLDCITGRRVIGREGEIYINGIEFESQREWYLKHSGYVLQLAVQYYEELTVRDNLLMAAFMSLPRSLSDKQRFERVESVLKQVELTNVKDVIVGGATGPGLSGGQKKRLAVAIQLLRLPEILFLDEPTSGLDSASSLDLLQHIRCLAKSGRLVVLTIHQPSLEIFHMFDRLLLLCQGEVAYYGSPYEAIGFFSKACKEAKIGLNERKRKNPADSIMDLLGSEPHRRAILYHYKNTFEQQAVKNAINDYKSKSSSQDCNGENKQGNSEWINRFMVLETRACLRSTLFQSVYLPVIFILFTLVAGLAYLQADSVLLIMASLSVFSFSSSIFVFPPVYNYLSKALEMHRLERHHGIGRSVELLLQTFMRYVAISAIPLAICSVILCLLILPSSTWNREKIFSVALFTLALNQTWTSIAIMLVCVFPVYGHKISPLVSCVAGFAGGFFIPPSRMKVYFGWLSYINPTYYGYAGMLRIVLPSIKIECDYQSPIECFPHTGEYWIEDFGIQAVKPYRSLLVLLEMTMVFLLIAWIRIEIQYWERTFTLGDLAHFVPGICKRKRQDTAADTKFSERGSTGFFSWHRLMQTRNSEPELIRVTPIQDTAVRASSASGSIRDTPDGEAAIQQRRQRELQRTSTRSSLIEDRIHSVYLPNTSSVQEDRNFETVNKVRIRVAKDTVQRQDAMETYIAKFVEMLNYVKTGETAV